MCSNFGLNLHPGRKPAAIQWQWYLLALRLRDRVRRWLQRGARPAGSTR